MKYLILAILLFSNLFSFSQLNKKDSIENAIIKEAMPAYYSAKARVDKITFLISKAVDHRTKNIAIDYYNKNLSHLMSVSNDFEYIKKRVNDSGKGYCDYLFKKEQARIAYNKADSLKIILDKIEN